MKPEDVLGELTAILRDTLGDDTVILTMNTVREDVPNWDSLNYITFMVAVQSRYGVRFKASNIEAFANIGEVIQKIIDLKGKVEP